MLMQEKDQSSSLVEEENSVELSLFAGLSFPKVPTHNPQKKLQSSTVSVDPLSSIKEDLKDSVSLSNLHVQPNLQEEDEDVAETSNLLQNVKKRNSTGLSTLYATEVRSFIQ